MWPASPTNVAGVAHSKWPASNDVGFAVESLALCEASQAKNMLRPLAESAEASFDGPQICRDCGGWLRRKHVLF